MAGAATGGRVPVLHVVTDDRVLAAPGFSAAARALLRRGGPGVALHVRGPATAGGRLWELAGPLAEVAAESGALLVVNDRVDVAVAVSAGGVHLGRRSLPVAEARSLVGPDTVVGVSIHAGPEAAEAASQGADWAFAGNVYATGSHPGAPAKGPALVRDAVAAAPRLAVLAIGGVTPARVAELMRAGAHGVAVIRGVWGSPDPSRALDEYQRALATPGGQRKEEG